MVVKFVIKISKGGKVLKEISKDCNDHNISSVVMNVKSLKSESEQYLSKLVEIDKKNNTNCENINNKAASDDDGDLFEEDDEDDEDIKPTEAKKTKLMNILPR